MDIREQIAPMVRQYCLDCWDGCSVNGGMLVTIHREMGLREHETRQPAISLMKEAERQGLIVRKNEQQYRVPLETVWPEDWIKPAVRATGRIFRVQCDLSSGEITATSVSASK